MSPNPFAKFPSIDSDSGWSLPKLTKMASVFINKKTRSGLGLPKPQTRDVSKDFHLPDVPFGFLCA
jgi:hypothetical protein